MKEQNEQYLVKLRNVILSFPQLYHPVGDDDSRLRYQASFLLDKKEHRVTIARIERLTDELIAIKAKEIGQSPSAFHRLLRDGEEKTHLDGYTAKRVFMNTATKVKPPIVNLTHDPVLEESGVIYPGCIVHANIKLWAQGDKNRKGVNAQLRSVMFVRDGERLGYVVDPEEEFADVTGEEEGNGGHMSLLD